MGAFNIPFIFVEAFVRKTMYMLKYTILEDNKVKDKIDFGNLWMGQSFAERKAVNTYACFIWSVEMCNAFKCSVYLAVCFSFLFGLRADDIELQCQ